MSKRTLISILSTIGLLIAIYLTLQHYDASVPLVCSATNTINCADVLTSPYAVVLGLPWGVWGMLWFALVLFANGQRQARTRNALLQLLGTAGALVVLYLIYTELFRVGAICIWCSSVHLLVLLIWVLSTLTERPTH